MAIINAFPSGVDIVAEALIARGYRSGLLSRFQVSEAMLGNIPPLPAYGLKVQHFDERPT